MFIFQKKYILLTIVLFLTEVLIALFVHDSFIRPYIGDVLVVMLIYCFCKSFCKLPTISLALGVLLFAYFIELLQYLHIVKWLGLSNSKFATIVIGNSFSWQDILCYTVGIAVVLLCEKISFKQPQTNL